MYSLLDVPSRGKGLVASVDIPRGSRILEEAPIITIPTHSQSEDFLKDNISQQVKKLNDDQQKLFFSMHNLYPYDDVVEQSFGIIRTNALPVECDGIQGAIFLEACRINHACDNNAQKHWNERLRKHTVHALRDIAKGEEITIYYLGMHTSRTARQKRLHEKFGFLCTCSLCCQPVEQSQKSDERLERIDSLDDLIGEAARWMNLTLQTLRYTEELVHLHEEQDSGNPGLARTYWDAAQIASANGDLARGSIFAKRAVEIWKIAYGGDSKEVQEFGALAENLKRLDFYGLSMEWKSSMDDIPHELDSNGFNDWLWRREASNYPKDSGFMSKVKNQGLFLSFDDLPSRDDDHLDYHAPLAKTPQTLRHWCFLGEIADFMTLRHLQLELRDINEKTVPLHFYTDGRGSELEATRVRKGHTVVVLYAKRHRFMYGDPGIRHEDPQTLKVCIRNPCGRL
jgi:hypothetical protein